MRRAPRRGERRHGDLPRRDQRGPAGKLKEAAAALYQRLPQPAAGDLIGQAILAAQQRVEFEVWPENWQSFELFASLSTQWRVGMNGPTGLDYSVLHRELDDLGLSGDERQQTKADIRVMEQEALTVMRSN
ncbi:hypothetical protein GCM10028796_17000 [Ramlibacter monticola]|uniref:DUF1799 domain-containing protein n=1 Tax=Ramlibacter monticola TaxID=1926872 RepID=A0A937CSY2_9BURK|nr:DUF1799 domain-containing protein [Ramlibacter monticola]